MGTGVGSLFLLFITAGPPVGNLPWPSYVKFPGVVRMHGVHGCCDRGRGDGDRHAVTVTATERGDSAFGFHAAKRAYFCMAHGGSRAKGR